jgi:hypothetical protein
VNLPRLLSEAQKPGISSVIEKFFFNSIRFFHRLSVVITHHENRVRFG